MSISLICPRDRQVLSRVESGYLCAECGRHYSERDGVVCTLDHSDDFYEGAYENKTYYLPKSEKLRHAWPLWLINGGYVWAARSFIARSAVVLELGCAGGVRYFGERYQMIGCDLSFSSLAKLDWYAHRIQADAGRCIPLPDNSVDAVVSSYFWEHIPPDIKPDILRECRRILKPGGKIVFLYDVETENPLIRRYKNRERRLYERLFIEGDGHFGYQTSHENITMFESEGFSVIKHQGMEKTWLQSPSVYHKLAQFGTALHGLFAKGSRLGEQPFFYPYSAVMRLIDTLICPWLPDTWARIDLVICEKKP